MPVSRSDTVKSERLKGPMTKKKVKPAKAKKTKPAKAKKTKPAKAKKTNQRTLTTKPARKVAWVGRYQTEFAPAASDEVLVMSDEAYTKIDRRNTIASKAQVGESWSSLVEQFGRDEVESVLRPVIQDARNILDTSGTSAAAMQKCLDFVVSGAGRGDFEEMWPYVYQPLDDADVILEGLPEAVVEMVLSPSLSPMTDYYPSSWDAKDLPRIIDLLTEAGWEVRSTTFHPSYP